MAGDLDKTAKPGSPPLPPTRPPTSMPAPTPTATPSPPGGNAIASSPDFFPAAVRPFLGLPPRKALHTIHADPVILFPFDSYTHDWPLVDKTIPLARGMLPVGGIPVTYNAQAKISGGAWFRASYGPGVVDNIAVHIGEQAAEMEEIAGGSLLDQILLRRRHSATATVRAHAEIGAGANLKAEASGGVDVADILGGGVTGGIEGTVSATAASDAHARVEGFYEDGEFTIAETELAGTLGLVWDLAIKAKAGLYVELKFPDIPILTDVMEKAQDWPVVNWFVPNPKKWRWRGDYTKEWTLAHEHGRHRWSKAFAVFAAGSSPRAAHAFGIKDARPYDFQSAVHEVLDATKPEKDVPEKDDSLDQEHKDGAKASVVAQTRQDAEAQVKSALANIRRERSWDRRALDRVRTRIKQAASAPQPKQATTTLSPVGAIGSAKAPDEQFEADVETRDELLTTAEQRVSEINDKIATVKDNGESRPEGPIRNESREDYASLAQSADAMGQAVGGYGEKADEFERPEDPAVPVTPTTKAAEDARHEARKVLDEVDEQVDAEMIRVNREWSDANQVSSLVRYATQVDNYRADLHIQCEKPLAKLEADYLDVPQAWHGDDEQAHAYRVFIIDEARGIERRFVAIHADVPPPPWDQKWAVLADRKLQVIPHYQDRIRKTMYPTEYWTDTLKWVDQTLTQLGIKLIDGQEYWQYTGPTYGQTSKQGGGWWLKEKTPENPEYPTIDHKHESVARHWNRSGHRETQPDRALYYNGYRAHQANLDVLPKGVNSVKGNTDDRIPFQTDVDASFRGPR